MPAICLANMYHGMRRILKNENRLVDYIPLAAHSLNLVDPSAVDCCVEAVLFSQSSQRLHAFFVASTHRWGVLTTHVKKQSDVWF